MDRIPTGDGRAGGLGADPSRAPGLDILKALGDNTRYAIYLELARSPRPLSTADIAEVLGLHVNTVRPHLERMREVGPARGDAPRRGAMWAGPSTATRWPPTPPGWAWSRRRCPCWPALSCSAAHAAGLAPDELVDAGREQGRADAARWPEGADALEALVDEQARLGFDPEVVALDDGAVDGLRPLPVPRAGRAAPRPGVQPAPGLVEGLVERLGGVAEATVFHPLVDRSPVPGRAGPDRAGARRRHRARKV